MEALPGGEGGARVDRVREEDGEEREGRAECDQVDEEDGVDSLSPAERVMSTRSMRRR